MGAKLSTPQPVDGNSAVTNRISKHHKPNKLPGHRFKSVGRSASSKNSTTMEQASQSRPIEEISDQNKHRKESNATEKTETKISNASLVSLVSSDPTRVPTKKRVQSTDKQQHAESGFRAIIACGGIIVEGADEFFEADVSTISSSGSHRELLPDISATKDVRVLESSSNCQKENACATPRKSNTRSAMKGNASTRPTLLSACAPEFIPSTIARKRTTSSSTFPPVNAADSTRQHMMGTIGNENYDANIMTPVRATNADICYRIDPPGSVIFVQPGSVSCLSGATRMEDKRLAMKSATSAKSPRVRFPSHPGTVHLPVPIVAKPRVFYCKGVRVTMVDDDCKIFVIDLVPREVCELIIQMTEDHLRKVEVNKGVEETWRALYTYTKMDLPCSEIGHLQKVTDEIIAEVVEIIGETFRDSAAAKSLKPRSWKEPHLLRYQKVDGKPDHTGVEMHFDGSHFTWQLMLSDEDDYEGGGTYFRSIRKTVRLKKGQVLVHPGDLYHKGIDIKSGLRNLIVCFMDGYDPKITDNSCWSDEKKEYEGRIITV